MTRTSTGFVCHTCSCGRAYTPAEWSRLEFVGVQDISAGIDGPAQHAELRNCSACGSTRCIDLPQRTAELVHLVEEHTKLCVRATERAKAEVARIDAVLAGGLRVVR